MSTSRPLRNRRDRWNLWNWRVRTKLLAVLLIPAIAAVVLGGLQVSTELSGVQQLGRTVRQVELGVRVSDLVHEVQRERELMSFFVAANRDAGLRAPLDVQKRRVDGLASSVRAAGSQLQGLDELVRASYQQSVAALASLGPLRDVAETTSYSDQAVITSYSAMINTLLGLRREVTRATSSRDVGDVAGAAEALGRAKEQVSQQHAVLLVAAVHGELPPNDIQAVRVADSRFGAAIAEFLSVAGADDRQEYADTVTGPQVDMRERIKQGAVQAAVSERPPGINVEEWDGASGTTSDLINKVETGLNGQLRGAALNLRERAGADAVRDATILLGSLFATLLLVVMVARSMLVPLRTLRDTAFDVADRRLPDAIRRIRDTDESPDIAVAPVDVHTREEIGQVARAFDAVHGEAVRLAAEQSLLRRNVNDMFVNLSRRSQGLVERQLRLIDQLENTEQDPEQLSNLFQLDHLATRMRRNSENLLVLAGAELARRSARPVPAMDVLRAAVSEVEEYQRIVVQTPPPVNVVGLGVNDLVHLVAELLDNATTFSPPNSRVMIRSSLTDTGELVVEIADEGVGMSYEQLVEYNQRLAEPPTIDVSISRRMGLFVVGRLAGRHGVAVRLGGNEAGPGLTAVVTVPADLVQSGEFADFGPRTDQVPVPRSTQEYMPTEVLPVQGHYGFAPHEPQQRSDWHPHTPPTNWPAIDDPTHRQPAVQQPPPNPYPVAEPPPMQVSMVDSMSGADLFTPVSLPDNFGSPVRDEPDADAALREIFGQDYPAGQRAAWPDTDQDMHFAGRQAAYDYPPARPEPPSYVAPPQPAAVPDHLGVGKPVVPVREETTPIYEEMVSAWFRELAPPTPAAARPTPTYVEPPPFEMPPVRPAARPEPVAEPVSARRSEPSVPMPSISAPPPLQTRRSASGLPPVEPMYSQPPAMPAAPLPPVNFPPVEAVPVAEVGGHGRHAAQSGNGEPQNLDDSTWSSPADEGWQAVTALDTTSNAGFTAAGLPRRRRGANLVPGAVVTSPAPSTPSRRARSADDVRGRLANYQQGLRQGRDARRDLAHVSLDPGSEHAAQHMNEESQ